MSKRNYGIPYMGSKNRIAKQIIDFLPSGETLVDLFGGGGAITDCASESGKWSNIIYNELDVLPYTCFLKALKGEYENETRWISREDFFKLKDTDEYVACCFSFGNNFRTYMYNEKIEPYKRAYHYAIVFNEFQPLSELFDKETVDMLNKSVEGETDKKQRRLKFTRALGNYIIGLSKEAQRIESNERQERLNDLKKTMQIDENARNLIENQLRKETIDTLKKTQLDNITFLNDDYRNVPIPDGSIIYCDIPYRNTGTYNKAEYFDYDAFYDWCVKKKEEGNDVFISEYSMPDDRFECVFEMSKISSLAPTKSSRVTEKIFVPKNML